MLTAELEKTIFKTAPEEIPEQFQSILNHYDDLVDVEFSELYIKHILTPLNENYFRTRFIGFEEEDDEPSIYLSNHSGMAFPWDGMMFVGGFFQNNNFDFSKSLRILTAPALSKIRLMNPYMVKNLWFKCGGIDATYNNFEALFYQDSTILVYPEGVKGIGKGFNNKYQLQRFATSFVRLSMQYKRKLVPVYTVNGEYIDPYVFSIKWINKLSARVGIPFIPIGAITVFILLQPWMFYMAFPCRLTYVKGKEIDPESLAQDVEDKEERINAIRDEVKHKMQQGLDEAVEKFGQKPYDLLSLFKSIRKNWQWFPFLMPFGWVFLFAEFERQWNEGRREDMKLDLSFWAWIGFMVKNPFSICYFIPLLGWIPIAIKGYQSCGEKK